MPLNPNTWKNQSVFLTGHTGFKGAWLSLWLNQLGANVHGYALEPPTKPSLFEAAHINKILASDTRANLLDPTQLKLALQKSKPIIIFHLAAQSLVRESYRDPLNTLSTNIIGTANLLEAAREIDSLRAIIIVTTDKVYENKESAHAYTENDALGGYDIYSASKAAAEIITSSYYRSFFNNTSVQIATARAGNVFGGGDWANDRLIPDCIRSFQINKPVFLRYPHAIRPWQHVLEPLCGYLQLAEKMLLSNDKKYSRAWNFGPHNKEEITVGAVSHRLAELWGDNACIQHDQSISHPHEAHILKLNSRDAENLLNWKPHWHLDDALRQTVAWYRSAIQGEDIPRISKEQIDSYLSEKVYA